jgi:adenine phosphoribosyltransferase
MTGGDAAAAAVASLVRDVPDFPRPGIVFKDIGPLLSDPQGFSAVVDALAGFGRDESGDVVVDKVLGIEARGFVLAAPVALALGLGFVQVRKAGKLPGVTVARSYELEYGTATLELQGDALRSGERVLVVDDVLATGGTIAAVVELVASFGATIGAVAVLIELGFLAGRDRVGSLPLHALVTV